MRPQPEKEKRNYCYYSPARQAVPGGLGVGPERAQQPAAAASHGTDAGAEARRSSSGRRAPSPSLPAPLANAAAVARVAEVAPDAAARGPGLVAASAVSAAGPALLERGEVAGLPAEVRDP